jgi:hypothetical protein
MSTRHSYAVDEKEIEYIDDREWILSRESPSREILSLKWLL